MVLQKAHCTGLYLNVRCRNCPKIFSGLNPVVYYKLKNYSDSLAGDTSICAYKPLHGVHLKWTTTSRPLKMKTTETLNPLLNECPVRGIFCAVQFFIYSDLL